ncbi:FecR family protein [Pedobacter sp. BS3]|uniref:FecR family protein n=1 Tax=Pedobacter sp. BS3 TaxID=2567937 RepID=UPI0011EFCABD|nr:FecR family protein [Pedobacter sp. BS3]TZF82619.1 FecR family protein [Pedobacter sp. BS3]
MPDNRIELLKMIQRYLADKATPAEKSFLKAYYSYFDKEQDIISQLKIEEKKLLEEQLETGIWNIVEAKERKPVRFLWTRIAAAAMLLFSLSTGIYMLVKHPGKAEQTARKAKPGDILPGTNKAVLTLANGKKIALDNARNGVIAQQEDTYIQKTADGKIIYSLQADGTTNVSSSALAYNTIEVPKAGQFQLVLPDGTRVWLNSQSTLRYPTKFDKNERNVELSGEAYFEVTHNSSKPFKVHTRNQDLTVLGTHFNVKAYTDETSTSTTLLQGKVSINNLSSGRSAILQPGNQSVAKPDGSIAVSNVNAEQAIAWKSGFFAFDNQDIETIMTIISRWYNVDVVYKNIDKNLRLGGTFSKTSNLSELLKNLELIGNIHFTIEERRVIVMK